MGTNVETNVKTNVEEQLTEREREIVVYIRLPYSDARVTVEHNGSEFRDTMSAIRHALLGVGFSEDLINDSITFQED